MNYNFENFLKTKITQVRDDLGFNDMEIIVATEQAFSKIKVIPPYTVYIVIKYLTSDITFGAIDQPFQILCLSEANNLDRCRLILSNFAQNNNFLAETNGTDFIKYQFTMPVVLSNYEEVGSSFRSVLYLTGSYALMENVLDVKDLKYRYGAGENDKENISQLSFNLSYSMTPNTQQQASEKIASSMKSSAVLSLALSVPMINNKLSEKVLGIVSSNDNYDGNEDFSLSFKIGTVQFDYNLKLTSTTLTTTPLDVPTMQLGFIK